MAASVGRQPRRRGSPPRMLRMGASREITRPRGGGAARQGSHKAHSRGRHPLSGLLVGAFAALADSSALPHTEQSP